jgi:aminomethyltransferase
MSEGAPAALLETPLAEEHRSLGGRLIDFAGWLMPVQYGGILDEHRAVRQRAGLFDLSHMGEVWITGTDAAAGLAGALVTDPPRLAAGRAHYSMICADDGGIIDDLIVYRLADERFLVVPNAANREAVVDALEERLAGLGAAVDDASLRTALVAIQGPRAAELLGPETDVDLVALRYYSIAEGHACGVPAFIARTGYTGEDGFELFVDWTDALTVWRRLLEIGGEAGLIACGLGARDTLRLEAGMPLYGNELSRTTNPFEAGLGRLVKLDKPADFTGRAALQRVVEEGARRALVGLTVSGRGIARHGHAVFLPGGAERIGVPIAMAYVPVAQAEPGTSLEVDIRGVRVGAEVVLLPFYKRAE